MEKNKASSKVILESEEGVRFEIDKPLAMQSETVKNLIDVEGEGASVVRLAVSGPVLSTIVEFWNIRAAKVAKPPMATRLRLWYSSFAGNVEELMEIVNASNYLNCYELISFTRKAVENIAPEDAAVYFELRGSDREGD